jgi:hypothetical protein
MALLRMKDFLTIPRAIWMMWSSGVETAPSVVRACVDSWRREHPSWQITILDRKSAGELIDFESLTGTSVNHLDPVVIADLLRYHLLALHGGVWVDATCFCMKPIEEWLTPYVSSGFFAFRNPGHDRLLSTWFIASAPNNLLTTALRDRAFAYWQKNRFNTPSASTWLYRTLTSVLKQNISRTRWWFSWPVTHVIRIYPYFWLHYLFNQLIAEDATCRALWEATPSLEAHGPHMLQFQGNGLTRAMSPETRIHLEMNGTPLFKLNHRIDTSKVEPGSPLDHLLKLNQTS